MRAHLELVRLKCEQQLLTQKYELEQKTTQLKGELKANRNIIQRVEALPEKMIQVDRDMYVDRLATIISGIELMQEQSHLVQKLVDGYFQLAKTIEIEYETSQLAEKLPQDIISQIMRRLEELKKIEEQKQEMQLLVEPWRLLRGMDE